MMRRLSVFAITALLSLCTPAVQAAPIIVGGSTTVEKFMQLAARAYEEAHPGIRVIVSGGGSSEGFGEAINGRVDIGMMSRELKPGEIRLLGKVRQMAIGFDAIAPMVSEEIYHRAGISNISLQVLARIYRGEISNWKQLGGPDRPMLLVDKDIHHGTHAAFASAVLGSADAPNPPGSIVLEDNMDIANLISASDQAIGYVSTAYRSDRLHPLSIRIDGQDIAPSEENIRNGSYPLTRKLYLLVAGDAPPRVTAFLAFVLSPAGQKLVRHAGYIPLQ